MVKIIFSETCKYNLSWYSLYMFEIYKIVTRSLQVCQCCQCVQIGGPRGFVKG